MYTGSVRNVPKPGSQDLIFRIKLEHAIVLVRNGVDEELMDLGGSHGRHGRREENLVQPSSHGSCRFIRGIPETIGQHFPFMNFTFRRLTIRVRLVSVYSDPRTVGGTSIRVGLGPPKPILRLIGPAPYSVILVAKVRVRPCSGRRTSNLFLLGDTCTSP